ncbi:MAG: hypothetical protein J7513_11465 [Solirubrobacteraceae bacterium]|nr:hypothetical protein [Solirubrobacteraceae bacterium]
MPLSPYPLPDLRTVAGFGVAGNFAGHLEQAGEAADFVGIGEAGVEAPKGIFPWYLPEPAASAVPAGAEGLIPEFLHAYPLAHDCILLPSTLGPLAGADITATDAPLDPAALNLQIEPEVGVLAEVTYDGRTGLPSALRPVAIGAFNDCSIRRPGAQKISHKKNWGAASKGVASAFVAIDGDLTPAGPTATWRLACFLRRDGQTHPYGIDSRLPDYSYYGDTLLDWIVDRLHQQVGAPETPLENVGAYLRAAGGPSLALIGIGATRYTPLGETTFLQPGDESIVIVYDAAGQSPAEIQRAVELFQEDELTDASVLRQLVERA